MSKLVRGPRSPVLQLTTAVLLILAFNSPLLPHILSAGPVATFASIFLIWIGTVLLLWIFARASRSEA